MTMASLMRGSSPLVADGLVRRFVPDTLVVRPLGVVAPMSDDPLADRLDGEVVGARVGFAAEPVCNAVAEVDPLVLRVPSSNAEVVGAGMLDLLGVRPACLTRGE